MSGWLDHLIIAPIIVPLVAGTVMMAIDDRRHMVKAVLGLISALALLLFSILLLRLADGVPTGFDGAAARIYRVGDWPALFGIVLVVDRLSALMLLLTSVLGLAVLVFSIARWHGVGAHFHSLVQFQLMGLNGAFLTGDLFNLFVFFEIMLAASYGLVLHGSGLARVRAGLHYVAINLAASLLFLIGVSMIYGVAGTLSMADLAGRLAGVAPQDRVLLEAGCAILGMVFLIKAGMWPLGFWLPNTYAVSGAPSAALVSILSKVGIYAVLRMWLLVFGEAAGESEGLGAVWLLCGGLATVTFGSIAVLATQNMQRLAGASVLVSSGTLLAAVGIGEAAVTGGALFYLTSSVLAIAAFFLLIELAERGRGVGANVLAVTREAFGEEEEEEESERGVIGIAIPGTIAVLGLCFLGCALLLAGLPPLSGFLGKLAMLVPLLGTEGGVTPYSWALLAILLSSGLATIIAMVRAGTDVFWVSPAKVPPRIRVVEIAPVTLLLLLCVLLTVEAEPVMRFMDAAAQSLHSPHDYGAGGLKTPPNAVRGGAN